MKSKLKKIEHYILPEHANNLYEKEVMSSMYLVKDIARKINEIVDNVNNLGTINLEKIQEQDGKINKGIVFIKDNLLNALNDYIGHLEATGFINNKIMAHTVELVSELDVLAKRVDNLLGKATDGSTTMDLEILDARIGTNGNDYLTLGNSIRSGLNQVNGYISKNLIQGSLIAGTITIDTSLKTIKQENAVVSILNGFYNITNTIPVKYEGNDVKYLYFNKTSGLMHVEARWYMGTDDILLCIIYTDKIFYNLSGDRIFTANDLRTSSFNKLVTFYGDSNIATNYFQPLVFNKLGIKVKNLGLSSSCISNFETWALSMSNDTRINEIPSDTDTVVIWGGINDWASRIDIGTIDSEDKSTFYGGYNYLIKKIIEKIPNARIVIMTPGFGYYNTGVGTGEVNGVGTHLRLYVEAVLNIAKKYHLPVVDVYNNMGVNEFNKDNFYIVEDVQVHPNNTLGASRIANLVINKLKEIGG